MTDIKNTMEQVRLVEQDQPANKLNNMLNNMLDSALKQQAISNPSSIVYFNRLSSGDIGIQNETGLPRMPISFLGGVNTRFMTSVEPINAKKVNLFKKGGGEVVHDGLEKFNCYYEGNDENSDVNYYAGNGSRQAICAERFEPGENGEEDEEEDNGGDDNGDDEPIDPPGYEEPDIPEVPEGLQTGGSADIGGESNADEHVDRRSGGGKITNVSDKEKSKVEKDSKKDEKEKTETEKENEHKEEHTQTTVSQWVGVVIIIIVFGIIAFLVAVSFYIRAKWTVLFHRVSQLENNPNPDAVLQLLPKLNDDINEFYAKYGSNWITMWVVLDLRPNLNDKIALVNYRNRYTHKGSTNGVPQQVPQYTNEPVQQVQPSLFEPMQ